MSLKSLKKFFFTSHPSFNLKSFIPVFFSALSFSLLFQLAPAAAQGEDDTIRLRTVMVTANRTLQELMDVPMTVNVVTAEDIEREPYPSITELIRHIPGIGLAEQSGARAGSPRVSLRGEGNARTLILINGVKLSDKDNSDPSILVNLSQVERIEVIKGPASVLYGSEAIGGVINIITKKGGDKPIGFSQNFVYDSSTESVDIQSAVFGNYNGFNYRVSGSGKNASDRRVPDDNVDGGTAYSSHYRNRYYSAQLGYDFGEHSFTLSADRYQNVTYYTSSGLSSVLGNTTIWFDPNDRDTVIGTFVFRELSEKLKKLTLTASYQIFDRDWISDFQTPSTSMTSYLIGHAKSEQKQLGFSAQSEWALGDHYLIAGLDYEGDDIRVANEAYRYGGRPDSLSHARVKQNSLGLFVQDEWALSGDFKATLGARYGYIKGKYVSKDGPSYVDDTNPTQSDSHMVGSVGVVYRGIANWAFRAQFSQGYRFPTVRQLFTGYAAHGSGTVYQPNPSLKPETSNNFEIGARFASASWDMDLAIFLTNSKNFIDSIAAAASPTGFPTFVNGDKARTIGAELTISYTHLLGNATISPYGQGAFIKRRVTLFTGPSAGQSTDKTKLPPLEGRIGIKADKPIGSSSSIFGDLYMDMAVKTKSLFEDLSSRGRDPYIVNDPMIFPAWQTLNLSLGIRGGEKRKYNVSLNLRNIFNQSYVMSRGHVNLPEAGFHVVLGAGLEF
jgi:hemoglobin/transferrin/lactoferrin receptor protein